MSRRRDRRAPSASRQAPAKPDKYTKPFVIVGEFSLTSEGQLELIAVPARGVVEDRDAHFHHAPRGEVTLHRLHEKRCPKT